MHDGVDQFADSVDRDFYEIASGQAKFFARHDPTQVNRQGPDWGSQYRSVIFTHSNEQFAQARARIAELNASGSYRKPIATQVVPATTFWKAEEYHQKYLEKRGLASCHI